MAQTPSLPAGIYRQTNGAYRVVAWCGDSGRRERRFPRGTSIRTMRAWQSDASADLRRQDLQPVRDTLAADAPKYLAAVRGTRPTDREYEINSWLDQFGARRRHTIKAQELQAVVVRWIADGVAASTIRHRLSALSMLYKTLDGPTAYNPAAGVVRPVEPKPSAHDAPVDLILRVFDALEARVTRHNRGWKTLARLKVIATTGMRHSQVMRVRAADIRLDDDPPSVVVEHPGKAGNAHWKPLTADGVAAFELFIKTQAFGSFSAQSVYKSWKLACADAGVEFFNPYRLRHAYATALRAGGLDLADVQLLLGHTSPQTTARYARPSLDKLKGAIAALDQAWSRARAVVDKKLRRSV